MVEVKLNFDEINLVPVGIKEVKIDGKSLKFICETEKVFTKKGNTLVISNAIATNLTPSDERVAIHIVSVYKNIDTYEHITVHERTYGKIESVENTMGNNIDEFSAYEIVIRDADLFDYKMEVKTEHEKLEDKIEELKNEVKNIEKFYKNKLEQEEEKRVKQVKELQDSIDKQAKEFKEFKDRIYRAFGLDGIHITSSGITGGLVSVINNNNRIATQCCSK